MKRERLVKISALTFFIFGITHGYRMANLLFSHDSLMINQLDFFWQISLGRYLQPLFPIIRGSLCSPFVVMLLTIMLLALSFFLLTELFQITKDVYVVFTVLIMVMNTTVGYSCATYIQFMDGYAGALLFSILSVYVVHKNGKKGFWLGMISIAISMAIYQAYVGVALGCILILFVINLLTAEKELRRSLLELMLHAATILAGSILYLLGWKGIGGFLSVAPANSYNSVGAIHNYNLFHAIWDSYAVFLDWFWNPKTFVSTLDFIPQFAMLATAFFRITNILVVVYIIGAGICICRKKKNSGWKIFLLCLTILVFPLAVDFICILSNGMMHELMMYAFCLIYFGAVVIMQEVDQTEKNRAYTTICLLAMTCVLWNSYIFINQLYLVKGLKESATLSYMTRIVEAVERTENYEGGVTPVAIVGTVEQSHAFRDSQAWKKMTGVGLSQAMVTYEGTENEYIEYILQNNINLVRLNYLPDDIFAMPEFPSDGSIKRINGIVVIKISDAAEK